MVSDEQNEEIEQLYRSMYDTLLCYAELHAKDLAPPEEIAQEVFAIACAKPDELLNSPNRKGWLMVAMKNVIRNLKTRHLRQQNAVLRLIAQTPTETEDPIDLHILYGPLADMEDFKLLLAQGNGTPVQTLAESLSISESACKKRLQRAREAIKKKIFDF